MQIMPQNIKKSSRGEGVEKEFNWSLINSAAGEEPVGRLGCDWGAGHLPSQTARLQGGTGGPVTSPTGAGYPRVYATSWLLASNLATTLYNSF